MCLFNKRKIQNHECSDAKGSPVSGFWQSQYLYCRKELQEVGRVVIAAVTGTHVVHRCFTTSNINTQKIYSIKCCK